MVGQAAWKLHPQLNRETVIVLRVIYLLGKETLTRPLSWLLILFMGVRNFEGWATVELVARSISAAMAALVLLQLAHQFKVSEVVGTR